MATSSIEIPNQIPTDIPTDISRRVLVLEHEADTPVGLIGQAVEAEGGAIRVIRPTTSGVDLRSVSVDEFDVLVILGSVHSVNDPAVASWLDAEIDLVKRCDQAGVPVFGICFGAQVLAVALGGSVHPAPYGEYSWKMVDSVAPSVIPDGPWFQWHVDAIVPPNNAVTLATSDCCVQAFTVGRHLGVQFHPEVDLQQATDWPLSDEEGFATLGQRHADLLEITEALLPEATHRAHAIWNAFLDHANSVR